MIAVFLAGLLISAVVLELLSLRAVGKIRIQTEADLSLCVPDEEITLRYTILNPSRFPVLYVGYTFSFDESVTVSPPEHGQSWVAQKDYGGVNVDGVCWLPAHSRVNGRIRFRLHHRGVYTVGKAYFEVGDLLGLKSRADSDFSTQRIVCTADAADDVTDRIPLGGLLGSVSVRRFLHDDPCLIVGYREYSGREPMKQISWTQTAKTGTMMVKQMDHTADTDVVLLVDERPELPLAMEHCLCQIRSLCEFLEDRKIPYEICANGDLGNTARGLGRGHLFPILRAIGLSQHTRYTDFSDVAERVIRTSRPDRTCIVVSPDPDPILLERLQSHSHHRLMILGGEENGL